MMNHQNTLPPADRARTAAPKPFTQPEVQDLGSLQILTQQIGVTLDTIPEGSTLIR
jgi:hypothetical protein